MNHLLVFGLGYSARRIAALALRRGWRVSGTRRTAEAARSLADEGVDGVVFDGTGPAAGVAALLPSVTHMIESVPPDGEGDPVLRHHGEDLIRARRLRWAGLLSTTGIYGDRGGRWVDEATPPDPGPARSVRRLRVERAWSGWAASRGLALQIFRLSGIYGPDRSVFDRLRTGRARRIVKPGMVFNRIHVDDIAGAVMAGIDRPTLTGPVNTSDDEPAPLDEVLGWAATRLGIEPPPEVAFEEAELSPMARSFWLGSRRVRNRRLRDELGYALLYPTYREGLEAILAGTPSPPEP